MTEPLELRERGEPDSLDVTIVLPVYNENGHIEKEVSRIRSAMDSSHYSYEILVIDDGSTDGSADHLRQLDGIRLISFTHNRGSGAARRVGTREALGRVVVWTDVDMTYPNEEIPKLVKQLNGSDQVIGARRTEEGTHKMFRVPAKWMIRRLASFLAKRPIPDLNSGFRAFRTDVGRQFLHMLPNGFSCSTTITMAFLMNGYSVSYEPIDYFPREGESKFHWWRDTKKYVTQVIRLIMSYDPLRVFVPIGFTLLAIGLGKLGYDLVANPWKVAANTLLVLFASFQVFAVGLLADLFVHLTRPRDEIDPARR